MNVYLRNDKEAKKGKEKACYDMILTNYHVVQDVAKKIESKKKRLNPDINRIRQIFAFETGKDILLGTGSPSAIRKSC